MTSRIAIARGSPHYPTSAPFHPSEPYPEYLRLTGALGAPLHDGDNSAYRCVRDALRRLGLDRANIGSARWNPLGEYVNPGDTVVIKPNLVTHEFRPSCGCTGDLFSVITHPSVIRAVADYVAIALQGRGTIVIGDNPSIDARFDELLERTQLDSVAAWVEDAGGVSSRVIDLRPLCTEDLRYYGYKSKTTSLPGDPLGAVDVDLGGESFFDGIDPTHFRGVFTDRAETVSAHSAGHHRYSLSRTIADADVYISVPKLKAHHKVGATLNVKGLVGINSNKNYLVHWRQGFPEQGGDEYPAPHRSADPARLELRHRLRDLLPEALHIELRQRLRGTPLDEALTPERRSNHERYRGAWDGNDTCWRMAADLYNAFITDTTGYRPNRPLRYFSVVDGIVAGEGDGPFCPTAKSCGVVVAGADLLAVDRTCVQLMDFDATQIRYLGALMAQHGLDESDIDVAKEPNFFDAARHHCGFAAPSGWANLQR